MYNYTNTNICKYNYTITRKYKVLILIESLFTWMNLSLKSSWNVDIRLFAAVCQLRCQIMTWEVALQWNALQHSMMSSSASSQVNALQCQIMRSWSRCLHWRQSCRRFWSAAEKIFKLSWSIIPSYKYRVDLFSDTIIVILYSYTNTAIQKTVIQRLYFKK